MLLAPDENDIFFKAICKASSLREAAALIETLSEEQAKQVLLIMTQHLFNYRLEGSDNRG